jgi:hypothetical protein
VCDELTLCVTLFDFDRFEYMPVAGLLKTYNSYQIANQPRKSLETKITLSLVAIFKISKIEFPPHEPKTFLIFFLSILFSLQIYF